MRRGFLQLLPDGPTIEITGDTRIGRGAQCELRVDSHQLGREHTMVVTRDGEFFARDLGSSFGTWLERAQTQLGRIGVDPVRLEDGDVLGLNDRVRFALEPVPADPLEVRLAEAVAADPDDAGRWKAYADRLLEKGDSRGARIVAASTEWQWPGHQVGSVLSSSRFEWAHGHIRGATLVDPDRPTGELPAIESCLQALVSSRVATFMVELEVTLARDPTSSWRPRGVPPLSTVFERSKLPALRRLRVVSPVGAPRLRLPGSPYLG